MNAPNPLVKTVTFAVLHFTVAFGVAYALTGSVVVGGAIALVEPLANTVAFYFHERLWARIAARRVRRPVGAALAPAGG
jgi:uncharacterized membrane protein